MARRRGEPTCLAAMRTLAEEAPSPRRVLLPSPAQHSYITQCVLPPTLRDLVSLVSN